MEGLKGISQLAQLQLKVLQSWLHPPLLKRAKAGGQILLLLRLSLTHLPLRELKGASWLVLLQAKLHQS
jgi:hypothetical protein